MHRSKNGPRKSGQGQSPLSLPAAAHSDVRFSNRPFGVKRFQTIHHCSVDVARGLMLLFGIGTKALPLWDSKTRRNNLCHGLAVTRTAGPSGHANSPHPSSREGHLSTTGWISSFLLLHLILHGAFTKRAVVTRARKTAPIPARSDADRPAPAGWAALRLLADVDSSF